MLRNISILILMILATTFLSSVNAARGPVLNYTFSEGSGMTTSDVTGNVYTGTPTNGPFWTSGPSGVAGVEF